MVFEMECPNWADLGNMISKICEDTDEPTKKKEHSGFPMSISERMRKEKNRAPAKGAWGSGAA